MTLWLWKSCVVFQAYQMNFIEKVAFPFLRLPTLTGKFPTTLSLKLYIIYLRW